MCGWEEGVVTGNDFNCKPDMPCGLKDFRMLARELQRNVSFPWNQL